MIANPSKWNYPRFFVIGAMKSGTSTLCHLLDQHPSICVSDPKEPEFFSKNFQLGWEWYDSLFDPTEETKLLGDGSTGYSKSGRFPDVALAINSQFPDAKIIYIVRHPRERIRSHWSHQVRAKGETQPLNEAIRNNPNYVQGSLYFKQISKFREYFSDNQILILFTEDLQSGPASVLAKCIDFFDLPHISETQIDQSPQHVTPDRIRLENPWVSFLMKIPGKTYLYSVFPRSLKREVKRLLRREVGARPEWSPQSLTWLQDELRDDSRAFLEYAGKPSDYWSGMNQSEGRRSNHSPTQLHQASTDK